MVRGRISVDLPTLPRERAAVAGPLLERLAHAVSMLLAEAPLDVLQQASAAPTGAGSLAELVSNLPDASPRLAAADPEAAAVARAAVLKRQILESVPTFSTEEVAGILGITTEGVRKRRLAGRLLALPSGSDFRYPAWQFTPTEGEGGSALLPGLEEVLAAMPVESPWVRFDLLTMPTTDGDGRNVLDLLRAGELDRAIATVAGYGEHGA